MIISWLDILTIILVVESATSGIIGIIIDNKPIIICTIVGIAVSLILEILCVSLHNPHGLLHTTESYETLVETIIWDGDYDIFETWCEDGERYFIKRKDIYVVYGDTIPQTLVVYNYASYYGEQDVRYQLFVSVPLIYGGN